MKMTSLIERPADGPDPVDIHVGKQLRYLRISRRMTQERVGAMVDLTFQQIQKYEKGTNRVSASVLYRLAHALEVPISVFFEGLVDDPSFIPEGDVPVVASLFATASELQQIEEDEVRTSLVSLIRALGRSRGRRVN